MPKLPILIFQFLLNLSIGIANTHLKCSISETKLLIHPLSQLAFLQQCPFEVLATPSFQQMSKNKTKQETLKEPFFVPFTCYPQSINNITGYLLHPGYISKIWPFLTTSIANRHMCTNHHYIWSAWMQSAPTSLLCPLHLFSHTLNSPLVIQGLEYMLRIIFSPYSKPTTRATPR